MSFINLPDASKVTLENVNIPSCFLGQPGELTQTSITIGDGKIADGEGCVVDMKGAMLLPAFVDMHTHLDKGHIWKRAPNPDGSRDAAIFTVGQDREANWSADDVSRRMDFALRCAFAHGTRAIRTHLDSLPPQADISWPVFTKMKERWAGRIDLQASSLMPITDVCEEGGFFDVAAIVQEHGGKLGCVTFGHPCVEDHLNTFFGEAIKRDLVIDFHVDENDEPTSMTLRSIAQKVIETGYDKPVVVGHCCAVSTQSEKDALKTLDLVARAGLHVVSLPMCNMYLQDRYGRRTPRWRGVTLVHEMKARGINVSFASDNTRDPFYAYGDLDMIEVMREATRIAHLDHSDSDWATSFSANPARACEFEPGSFETGAPADFVICKARSWTELLSRPQSDRIVIRNGKAIDRTLPDYAELDDLMDK